MPRGGFRIGAGRKPKPKAVVAPEPTANTPEGHGVATTADLEPLEFLRRVMLGRIDANPSQVRAAIAAAQYVHIKRHDGGKKDDEADAAKKAGAKFKAAVPPKLVVNNRRG